MKMKENVTKYTLCDRYKISRETLRKLMNVDFFEELEAVGYNKLQKIISPRVQEKFIELYGEPKNHFE